MRFFEGYASGSAFYFIMQSDSVRTCHKTGSQYLSGSEHEDNFRGLDWRWESKTLGASEEVFSLSRVAITIFSPLDLPAWNEQTLKLTSRPKLRLFAHHCAGTHPSLHILYEEYDLTSVMVIDTDFLTQNQFLLLFVCEYSWNCGPLMRRNSELTHSTT